MKNCIYCAKKNMLCSTVTASYCQWESSNSPTRLQLSHKKLIEQFFGENPYSKTWDILKTCRTILCFSWITFGNSAWHPIAWIKKQIPNNSTYLQACNSRLFFFFVARCKVTVGILLWMREKGFWIKHCFTEGDCSFQVLSPSLKAHFFPTAVKSQNQTLT